MRGISVGGGRDLELHQEDLYREHVRAAAEAEVSDIFLNMGVRHAAIVVEYLFWVAKGQVEILTRELDPLVFGVPSVVTAARRFLDRGWELPGALLRILVEDSVDLSHHPLITSTVDFSKTEVRVVPKLIQQTYQCSLIVADSKHYWFQESRDRPEAVVQFNAPETGKQFHEIFEKIWSHSR